MLSVVSILWSEKWPKVEYAFLSSGESESAAESAKSYYPLVGDRTISSKMTDVYSFCNGKSPKKRKKPYKSQFGDGRN